MAQSLKTLLELDFSKSLIQLLNFASGGLARLFWISWRFSIAIYRDLSVSATFAVKAERERERVTQKTEEMFFEFLT